MKNNIRLLDKEQLKEFINKYSFSIVNDMIVVECKNFSRLTVHPIDKPFNLSMNKRKITIDNQTINFWKKTDCKFSLIKIQQCINILILSYQDVTEENILKLLQTN